MNYEVNISIMNEYWLYSMNLSRIASRNIIVQHAERQVYSHLPKHVLNPVLNL